MKVFNIFKSIKGIYKDVFGAGKHENLYLSDDAMESSPDLTLIDDAELSRSGLLISTIAWFLLIFFLWAYFFNIDEVTRGQGKVVPSSKEQIVQSLDGGILKELNVSEGDIVDVGTVLAQLENIRTTSTMEESLAKYRADLAVKARLEAEVNKTALVFPDELREFPSITNVQTNLYNSRKSALESSIKNLQATIDLTKEELNINTQLSERGAASKMDVLRLQRQVVELQMKIDNLQDDFYVKAREELARVSAEIKSLEPLVRGRVDFINKSTIKSPVKGIVKNIIVSTIGGVIPPNGSLMTIVPIEDKLLIEAKIKPKDVAFIHPGQHATVKITSYDYAIYGGLNGTVKMISPDTIKDETNPREYYYNVYIETDNDYLDGGTVKARKTKLMISPGMIATVEIKTGHKTIFQYLVKPFNKIEEALRER